MERQQPVHGLDFDNQAPFDNQVGPKCVGENQPIIFEGDRLLTVNAKA